MIDRDGDKRAREPVGGDDAPRPEAGMGRVVQGRIGDQLRAMYDDLVAQPVPDRFHDLLSRLEGHKER